MSKFLWVYSPNFGFRELVGDALKNPCLDKTCILVFKIQFFEGTDAFRVCLFGGEIGWMKNFEEKMGRKTFLECVWLDGEEEK